MKMGSCLGSTTATRTVEDTPAAANVALSLDPDFMLGISRSITKGDDGVRVLEYTMPVFIENVYDEYKDNISELKLRSTRILPLDEGFIELGMSTVARSSAN